MRDLRMKDEMLREGETLEDWQEREEEEEKQRSEQHYENYLTFYGDQ